MWIHESQIQIAFRKIYPFNIPAYLTFSSFGTFNASIACSAVSFKVSIKFRIAFNVVVSIPRSSVVAYIYLVK